MKDRSEYIGSSDAKRIVDGDWLSLYQEKKGLVQPEDLSGVFRVQLGILTENFHLDWLRDQCGLHITERNLFVTHKTDDFICSTMDAWCADLPVEVKHTNQFATLEGQVEYYLPQLAHHCLVAGTSQCWFSFIGGNNDPKYARITIPADYIERLHHMEQMFWNNHMVTDTPPDGLYGEPFPDKPKVLIDDMRVVDMTTHNEWAMLAGNLIETAEAHGTHEHCKKELKSLVEADVRLAEGHGVRITRTKANSLVLKILEDKADATAA